MDQKKITNLVLNDRQVRAIDEFLSRLTYQDCLDKTVRQDKEKAYEMQDGL